MDEQEPAAAEDGQATPASSGASLRLAYELTEQDIYELQFQVLRAAQLRIQRAADSKWGLVVGTAVVGVIVWPAWRWVVAGDPKLRQLGAAASFGVYVAILLIAGGALLALAPRLNRWRPKGTRLLAWRAKRLHPRAVKVSVLGPATLEVTDSGLLCTNAAATLQFPWNSIRRILHSPTLLSLEAQVGRGYIAIPQRAFPDNFSATAFLHLVEQQTQLKAIELAD